MVGEHRSVSARLIWHWSSLMYEGNTSGNATPELRYERARPRHTAPSGMGASRSEQGALLEDQRGLWRCGCCHKVRVGASRDLPDGHALHPVTRPRRRLTSQHYQCSDGIAVETVSSAVKHHAIAIMVLRDLQVTTSLRFIADWRPKPNGVSGIITTKNTILPRTNSDPLIRRRWLNYQLHLRVSIYWSC